MQVPTPSSPDDESLSFVDEELGGVKEQGGEEESNAARDDKTDERPSSYIPPEGSVPSDSIVPLN